MSVQSLLVLLEVALASTTVTPVITVSAAGTRLPCHLRNETLLLLPSKLFQVIHSRRGTTTND